MTTQKQTSTTADLLKEPAGLRADGRVSLTDLVEEITYTTGEQIFRNIVNDRERVPAEYGRLTLCLLRLKNGMLFVGQSIPYPQTKYNAEVGRTMAKADALTKVRTLIAYEQYVDQATTAHWKDTVQNLAQEMDQPSSPLGEPDVK